MKNKKFLKILALVACAVLLVVGSVAATFAYLTSTVTIQNTFTSGNVTITMDEAVTDEYGVATSGRTPTDVNAANTYKLIPGRTYTKDTTIHVAAGSENCYIFVKVENNLGGIVGEIKMADGWTPIALGSNIYYYEAVATAAVKDYQALESFTVATDADLSGVSNASVITITGYAVQADGAEGNNHAEKALDAWTKAAFTN